MISLASWVRRGFVVRYSNDHTK